MFSVINPATEDVIAEVPRTPVEQVDEIIATARAALCSRTAR